MTAPVEPAAAAVTSTTSSTSTGSDSTVIEPLRLS
jgi:hypothetical protein